MSQFLGYGRGVGGTLSISSPANESPAAYSVTITSGSKTATISSNYSGSNGDCVVLEQARGTSVGSIQTNYVVSGSGSTSLTLLYPADFTCTDSGASQAQLITVPEYSGITISSTLTTKPWNADLYGLTYLLCNGLTTITGTIDGSGAGYLGGLGYNSGTYAGYGEGTTGARLGSVPGSSGSNNGNGGGATSFGSGSSGGHATAGISGLLESGGTTVGTVGSAIGDAKFTTGIFRGGGAAGSHGAQSPNGGTGGAIVILITKRLICSTGLVSVNGQAGFNHTIATGSGGSGGAAGSIYCQTTQATLGTNVFTALGGIAGTPSGTGVNGVAGAIGRIFVNSCSMTGSTNPAAATTIGGQNFCGGSAYIF